MEREDVETEPADGREDVPTDRPDRGWIRFGQARCPPLKIRLSIGSCRRE